MNASDRLGQDTSRAFAMIDSACFLTAPKKPTQAEIRLHWLIKIKEAMDKNQLIYADGLRRQYLKMFPEVKS
jgi:hypothetical protein